MASNFKVMIYGGCGGLGSALVSHFCSKGAWVLSVDTKVNEEADANAVVDPGLDWVRQEESVVSHLAGHLGDGSKLDSIINVAGGWAGGSAASKDMVRNADLMWRQSVWSSTIAARVAALHMKEGGLLVLPGARPAINGTPSMIGYGMAKASVHQLTKSLACDKSGLPSGCCVYAILPVTLDTPNNRKWMPKADKSKWTPLEFVAELIFDWSKGHRRPEINGSLVQMVTENNKTQLICE